MTRNLKRRRGFMVMFTSEAQAIAEAKVIKSYGGNLIRWQLNTLGITYPDYSSYRVWLDTQLDMIKAVITSNPKLFNKVKIIIDLHHPPVWQTRAGRKNLYEVWADIARRFKGKSQILGYDLMNEPGFSSQRTYQKVMQNTADAIRKIDPKTVIIVEPKLGKPKQMRKLKPLVETENVWYSPHFYEPGFITYQGMIEPLKPIPRMYPTKSVNKELLRKLMKPILTFQEKYKTRIYVGEFSCARFSGWPNHKNSQRWISDVVDLFEEYEWDWSFHAFREHHGWDIERGWEPTDYAQEGTRPALKVLKRAFKKN